MIKYEKGYCSAIIDEQKPESHAWITEVASRCQKLVVGIPDEWVIARIFGDAWSYSAERTKDFLLHFYSTYALEVIVLKAEELPYQKVFELIHFDACFYGTEYGKAFWSDSAFMKEHHVDFLSMIPEKRRKISGGGSLRIALEDLQRHQKVILFGTGVYFDGYMDDYGTQYRPAFAIDNDRDKWGENKRGVLIKGPEELKKEAAQDVLVVICAKNYREIVEQLKILGDYEYRTLLFFNDISLLEEFAITSAEERAYLEKTHRILTTILKDFDRVCLENQLHYYVICGSLIGVVRHQNHIPWDDDIDVAMPRKDFMKLKKIAKKIWKNDEYLFLDYSELGGGAFLDCMPRLYYMKEHIPTKCCDKIVGKVTSDIVDRPFLDIYVMDNAHTNEKVHAFIINIMKGIYNLMMGHRAYINYDEYKGIVSEKVIEFMKKIHRIGSGIPLSFLAFWYDFFARSANWNKKSTDYIMDSCAIRCIELKYPKSHFGKGRRMPFDGIEVMVPSDYDAQLKAMRYQNYMEFPRMSVRKPSHYFNSDITIS